MIDHGTYWAPDAVVHIFRVPWDSAYNDVIDWDTKEKRDAWMAAHETDGIELENVAYHRTGSTLMIDVPYRDAYTFNYVHVHNGSVPTSDTPSLDFYYFAETYEMTNPATTAVVLNLDAWTTYWPTTTVNKGFLTQGHIAMAESAANTSDNIPEILRDYYATPEGISVGDEMLPYLEVPFSLQLDEEGNQKDDWIIIISTAELLADFGESGDPSSIEITNDFGTVGNPKLKTAVGHVLDGVVNGCGVYALRGVDFTKAMKYLSDYPWISQCIISITTVPWRLVGSINPFVEGQLGGESVAIWRLSTDAMPESSIGVIDFSHITGDGWSSATAQYRDIKKLWEYPYSVVQLENGSGEVLNLKPQLLPGNITTLKLLSIAISPFIRAAIYPSGYGAASQDSYSLAYVNSTSTWNTREVPYGDFLQTALWFGDFPQWSIVNNSYLSYIASHAATIYYNYQTAEWNSAAQKTRLDNAQTTLVATNEALRSAAETNRRYWYDDTYGKTDSGGLAGRAMQMAQNNTEVNYGSSVLSGAGSAGDALQSGSGGGASGHTFGAINSYVTTAVDIGNAQNAYNFNRAVMDANIAMEYSRSTDPKLRGRATRLEDVSAQAKEMEGDLIDADKEQNMRGIQAGIHDAALTPPSTSGQAGGDGFRYANGLLFNGCIKYMRVADDAIIRSGQYFRRFGYSLNRYINVPHKLNVCSSFSYYKFMDLDIINAYCSESIKSLIKGIFYAGVTVWETPEMIGNTDIMTNKVKTMGAYYV